MGFFQEKNIKEVQTVVGGGVRGEMRFEDNHVEHMTASCAQREDGNISLWVRTVIRGPNV
jgi:hypothetical protein